MMISTGKSKISNEDVVEKDKLEWRSEGRSIFIECD